MTQIAPCCPIAITNGMRNIILLFFFYTNFFYSENLPQSEPIVRKRGGNNKREVILMRIPTIYYQTPCFCWQCIKPSHRIKTPLFCWPDYFNMYSGDILPENTYVNINQQLVCLRRKCFRQVAIYFSLQPISTCLPSITTLPCASNSKFIVAFFPQ